MQAISKSGTNINAGSFYGFFRDDSLNAPDPVAKKVLPYANQQIGGTLGGPIVKDKLHYFASYEYEREPGTMFVNPSALPARPSASRTRTARTASWRASTISCRQHNRLSVRGSRWNWSNPFVLTHRALIRRTRRFRPRTRPTCSAPGRAWQGRQPHAGDQGRLQRLPLDQRAAGRRWSARREYRVPGLTFGAPYNYPQTLNQNNWTGRARLQLHKDTHDLKIGAEYIHVHNGGPWFIQRPGFFTLQQRAGQPGAVLPADAALDPSAWNLAPLNALARDFQVELRAQRERLDDRRAAADLRALVRRQLARATRT